MRVLVTGGNGFIGTNLVKILYSYSHNGIIECFTRGSTNREIQLFNPTHVFHLAANPLVKDNSYKVSESNIVLTHRLLDCISSECKFIFTSSATVIDHHNNPSVYSWSKLACEELIKIKHKNHLIFRLVAQIGPYSTHGVVHDIIRKLKSGDKELNLLTNSTKPYMHVKDTIDIILHTTFNTNFIGKYNISPENSISIEDMANIIMKELNIYKKIIWSNKSWAGDSISVNISSFFNNIRSSKEAILKYVRTIR